MNSLYKTGTAIAGFALVLGAGMPALALDATVGTQAAVGVSAGGATAGAKVSAAMQARITKGKERADQEIDRRINALNELSTKIQAMTKVSDSVKSSIGGTVTAEIGDLTSLKGKIDTDADIDALKTDIKSITQSYRIFMLVIPQGRITVAADKVNTVGASLTDLAGKLQTRISAAQSAGTDVTAMNTSLSDMNAKVTDASVQANAAVSAVASLTPDNGDKTKMQSNNAALKDARAKLKAAATDIEAARKDAHSIAQALQAAGASANAGASASATGQTTQTQ